MSRIRPAFPSSTPGIEVVQTDDGSRTLRLVRKKSVTWHSASGALSESQLVYLENSGVAKRLANGQATSVFEVGFGTGLNFWLTASWAMQHQSRLEYTAVETDLINWTTLAELEYDKLSACHDAIAAFARLIFRPGQQATGGGHAVETVLLNLIVDPLQAWLKNTGESFDAIYFDPFDPDEAPQLWQPDVFTDLYQRTRPGGRLVTYCVKSSIQKAVAAAGFHVTKTPGPDNGKREVLVAHRSDH